MTFGLLEPMEPRLRALLPAKLYAQAWSQSNTKILEQINEHLRTLRYILQDYVPSFVAMDPSDPGYIRTQWRRGALMFTDLAGFTSLVESYATEGSQGSDKLLAIINSYYGAMVEIISKSAGDLLEWTGDAMLIQFQDPDLTQAAIRATRAGLRMQRLMQERDNLESPRGTIRLGMRIGIHAGSFLSADIGTPRRMENIILGDVVQKTKQAEGNGKVERVCLTTTVKELLTENFHIEHTHISDHWFVVDDITSEQLGEYDLQLPQRRMRSGLFIDRSEKALIEAITEALPRVEQLAAYIPATIRQALIEHAAQRTLPARFVEVPILFMSIRGLTNSVTQGETQEQLNIVRSFSYVFNIINAIVESEDGILKNITYDKVGSTILIYFGGYYDYADGVDRAARAALAIREEIQQLAPVEAQNIMHTIDCAIGLSYGAAFIAEIGEARGRREFNILGDTVNIAARIMACAHSNQIIMNKPFQAKLSTSFTYTDLGKRQFKGKSIIQHIYALDK